MGSDNQYMNFYIIAVKLVAFTKNLIYSKKENAKIEGINFLKWTKNHTVAAHLRSLRPAPTSTEDTLMLRINSNISTFLQTLNYHYHTYL